MNDRYHVFKQGQKLGPFSIVELLSEIEAGHCEYHDWCLRVGAVTCETIRDVLDWEDRHVLHEVVGASPRSPGAIGEGEEAGDEGYGETPADQDPPSHALDRVGGGEQLAGENEEPRRGGEDFAGESSEGTVGSDGYYSEQEFDFGGVEPTPEGDFGEDDDPFAESEDEWESDERTSQAPSSLPPADPMAILYSGRPSILSFPISLLLTALSLAAGVYFRGYYEWVLSLGTALAVMVFVTAQLRCMKYQFFIRPRQIEVVHGLLFRNSRELCIEDIGAIHIQRRGLRGLLGLESVEFASTESPMIVAAFHNVRCARRIKSLIRRLQEVRESQRLPR